jgi:hypothetical protein
MDLHLLEGEEMIYFEKNQPHFAVWPYLAVGFKDEFWVGFGWLNCEIGWRKGEAKLKEKNT